MIEILIAVAILGVIALISALILWYVAKKFAVKEDPRLAQVGEVLPQANCGGCGFPGCSAMADACVKAADKGSLEGLNCPVGGKDCMDKIAAILGMTIEASAPKMAVVRCNGTCEYRPQTNLYDGVKNCRIAHTTGRGETMCAYGCLGCGDCADACQFGGITINKQTGLPEVNKDLCTGCGACAKACPRNIIEIRTVDEQKSTMVVRCMNKDKGASAKKACAAACIGCMKCQQVCGSDAIKVESFLAYIDAGKCTSCRSCEEVCPQGTIIGLNMEPNPKRTASKIKPEKVTSSNSEQKCEPKATQETKNSNVRLYPEAFELKYDAPLLPSQQYLLHGTVDMKPQETKNQDNNVSKNHNYDAPLLPSQQILLGL